MRSAPLSKAAGAAAGSSEKSAAAKRLSLMAAPWREWSGSVALHGSPDAQALPAVAVQVDIAGAALIAISRAAPASAGIATVDCGRAGRRGRRHGAGGRRRRTDRR